MPSRYTLALMLSLAGACLDTHDASLGEQEPDAALDGGGSEAGQPPPDAGPDVEWDAADDDDDEGQEVRDASTSLLCRLEPWHCT